MTKSEINYWLNMFTGKAILFTMVIIFGILTIVGFAYNYIVGIVFSVFLIISIRAFVGAKEIEKFIDDLFNKGEGPF